MQWHIQHIHYQVSYKVYAHTIYHADYGLQLEVKINHLLCLKNGIQLSTYLVHITMPIFENQAQWVHISIPFITVLTPRPL